MEYYEVDLRNRINGDSVECIYSGGNYDEAWNTVEKWNIEHVPDYKPHTPAQDYIDGNHGLVADCYQLDEGEKRFGVGKM